MKSSNSRRSRHDIKPVIHSARGVIFNSSSTCKEEIAIKKRNSCKQHKMTKKSKEKKQKEG